jgi:tetratricopeptide (TPR) repeat protein
MRFPMAATVVAALPFYCVALLAQIDNPCLSIEDRQRQFRADYMRPSANASPQKQMSAADCLAAARSNPENTPPPGGPVSFYKLTHKIPAKAKKAFEKGVMAAEAEDRMAAEKFYRSAIELDPGYLEARNNLAACLMKRQEWKAAIEQLNLANELDPTSSSVHSNLGVVYLQIKEYAKAEHEARLAVTLDATAAKPHYVLGLAMVYQRKDLRIAKAHLEKAVHEIPNASLILAKINPLTGG